MNLLNKRRICADFHKKSACVWEVALLDVVQSLKAYGVFLWIASKCLSTSRNGGGELHGGKRGRSDLKRVALPKTRGLSVRDFTEKQPKTGILKAYSRLVGVSVCFLCISCNLVSSSFKFSNSLILKRKAKSLLSNSTESNFILLEKENLTITKPTISPNKTPSTKLTKMLTLPNLMANSNILPPLFLGDYTKKRGVLWK